MCPMKAVLLEVSEADLALRRRIGIDRWDEVWEGVLHMAPAPTDEPQRIVDELIEFLRPLLRKSGRGTLRSGINVFDEASPLETYRIPDLTFVTAERTAIMKSDGIRGGGPDRDTKVVELFRLAGGQYLPAGADAQGGRQSEALEVRFQSTPEGRLVVQDLRHQENNTEI